MIALSPERNSAESRLKIKTRLITRSLYGLLLVFAGVILLTGLLPNWIGEGKYRPIATQLIILGSFILLAFFMGLRYEKYLARNPDFENGAVWYTVNVVFLLAIMISIRLPYCCQHDGWKMLAVPIQALIKNMIN